MFLEQLYQLENQTYENLIEFQKDPYIGIWERFVCNCLNAYAPTYLTPLDIRRSLYSINQTRSIAISSLNQNDISFSREKTDLRKPQTLLLPPHLTFSLH